MTSRVTEGGARHMVAQQENRSPALRANEDTSASLRSPDKDARPASMLAPDPTNQTYPGERLTSA